MLEPLEVQLKDFPNISIKGSEMNLPFQAVLLIDVIGEEVLQATKPVLYEHNLYDDWLTYVAPHTAFSRLMLILRALMIAPDRAKAIIRPTADIPTKPQHVWPTLDEEQWIVAENALK
ncbi:pre-mRNA-processing-splicing factor 8, partial [Kipferlia bialata]|eukprot:g14678.t1